MYLCGEEEEKFVTSVLLWSRLQATLRPRCCSGPASRPLFSTVTLPWEGETAKNRAEKAKDLELAAWLDNKQHSQMIQREDQETTV
uniref:Uncharacterized protein n=1 Tax=Knipowitschia caucasica TaxID=637954 RepID=A0AAV2L9D3_KNICA